MYILIFKSLNKDQNLSVCVKDPKKLDKFNNIFYQYNVNMINSKTLDNVNKRHQKLGMELQSKSTEHNIETNELIKKKTAKNSLSSIFKKKMSKNHDALKRHSSYVKKDFDHNLEFGKLNNIDIMYINILVFENYFYLEMVILF